MFDPNSRYYNIQNAVYENSDGHRIAYKRRRFLSQGDRMPVMATVVTDFQTRLDTLAAQALGDPEQFWRICDANNAMNPLNLIARPGKVLRIPVPHFQDIAVNPLSLPGVVETDSGMAPQW